MTARPAVDPPFFTVVMATFGRGRHIVPSIQSVLGQTFTDFELVVVGDHCDDDTARTVRAFAEQGVRWINLPHRCGSQSAPNNAGIAVANGQIIAYLGHDDIWAPAHLQTLAAVFETDPRTQFAVAGAIFHLPDGVPGSLVTGLFDDDSAKHSHFFPPSSFAHRTSVCDIIGPWNLPFDITAPVDADFLLRAAKADLAFASTGTISVHKFAAGHRYLSYLQPDSTEQAAMLASLRDDTYPHRISSIVGDAHRLGTFMSMRHPPFDAYAPGQLARQNAARKGLRVPQTMPLKGGVIFRQTHAECSLDWQNKPKRGIRWANKNPNPRYLLPYAGGERVNLSFRVFHKNKQALGAIALSCNGMSVKAQPRCVWRGLTHWRATYSTLIDLQPNAPTILQFQLDDRQAPSAQSRGIGLGAVRLVASAATASGWSRLARAWRHIALAVPWWRYR